MTKTATKNPLTAEEREKAVKAFHKKANYIAFADIVRVLKKPKGTRFNYPDKKTVATCSVSHQLNNVFSKCYDDWTREVCKADGKQIIYTYQTAVEALMFFDDDNKLLKFAKEKLGLDAVAAEAFTNVVFKDGYAQYSLAAIKRINPFLKKGLELSQAVFLARLPDVLGREFFADHEDEIIADVLQQTEEYRANLRERGKDSRMGVIPLQKRLRYYLQEKWGITDEQFNTLYFRDDNTDDSYANVRIKNGDTLPPVNLGILRNPLVQRALTVLRKHVNFLRHEGLIDADTRIHIELARSVNDRNSRMAWAEWQKTREDTRQKAREGLAEIGCQNPSETDILRYILWQEQGRQCLYTGHSIAQAELLSPAFDIEHTIPRCRSGNNSQTNLTLCAHDYNCQTKKGRIPSECENYGDINERLQPWRDKVNELERTYLQQLKKAKTTPQDNPEARANNRRKALVTRQELNYWRDKLFAFTAEAERLTQGFMNRQLVDTGIITRHALALLRTVYKRTYPVNGTAVAWARQGWGIQKIAEKKERTTHLHHAIDAMVVAGLDRSRFNGICAWCKDDAKADYSVLLPEHLHPFPGFSQAVFDVSERILVKHLARHVEMKQTTRRSVRLAKAVYLKDGRILRKVSAQGDTVRGQLHKDSFYGCIQNPETGGRRTFVIRKVLSADNFKTTKDFDKIVDPAIRKIVLETVRHLAEEGLGFREIMEKAEFQMPSGIPIRKVRIRTTLSEPQQIRSQTFASKHEYKKPYYVESGSGSNFRLAIMRRNAAGKVTYEYISDNLLDWAKRESEGDAPHNRLEKGTFLGYIKPGQLALLYDKMPDELRTLDELEISKRLYGIVAFESDRGRIIFRYHAEARSTTELAAHLKENMKRRVGESTIDFKKPHELLRLSPRTYFKHALFEGIHFEMDMTGKITFKDNTC